VVPIPISDENPPSRRPVVTIALIVVNALAWFYQLSLGVQQSTLDFGAIPGLLLHGVRDGVVVGPTPYEVIKVHQAVPWPLTIFTSMFMHGGWLHIIGNMWFLWIFGDNVEDAMGSFKFLIFYLLCGVAAAAAQIFSQPGSAIPMVGASGAIAGVLGAYLMLYPHARVRCLLFLFIIFFTVYVPAWLVLGLWFVSQFLMPGSGIAWMAHVGGFVVGFILVRLFVIGQRPPPRRDQFPPLWERVPRPPRGYA
jgi:membrane associated rhomboid family serine protease